MEHEQRFVFSNQPLETFVAKSQVLSEGDMLDLNSGGGVAFAVIEVKYGEHLRYKTRVCEHFKLIPSDQPTRTPPKLDQLSACPGDYNYAN
jgi:hypothetical protein